MREQTERQAKRRFGWRTLLILLVLPLYLGYNWYLEDTKFPVVPDIITQEEFQELLAGREKLQAGMLSRRRMKEPVRVHSDYRRLVYAWDDDGDGTPDYHIRLERTPKGNLEEGYFATDSRVVRAHFLDVLFGGEGFGILDERMWVESDEGMLIVTVFRPDAQDHGEFRPIVEAMLEEVRTTE